MTPLILFGAGGHAREVAQVVHDINHTQPGTWQLLGFMADSQSSALNPKPLPAPSAATWPACATACCNSSWASLP